MDGLVLSKEIIAAFLGLASAVGWMTRSHIADLKDQIAFLRGELTPLIKTITDAVDALEDRVRKSEEENGRLRRELEAERVGRRGTP